MISEAGGNEIFVAGYRGKEGLVERLELIARGNESSVLALLDRLDGEADVIIHNHPSGNLAPSDNDLIITEQVASQGLGSYIVDNEVQRVYVIVEPVDKKEKKLLDPVVLCGALQPGGAIAQFLSPYEARQSQLDLMELVIQAFNRNQLLVAEAGTGVGKSFAYLIPAIAYAILNKERVVISTATITLQHQLYEKDIPLLTKAFKKPIKALVIKGRNNYLCLRRLVDMLQEGELELAGSRDEIESIHKWAETTETGNKAELPFVPSEVLWSRICSESDLCSGLRCAYRDRCFVLRLKREAATALILVVNHHLLFADLAARKEGGSLDATVVLPPYRRLVLDEAHTIEQGATSFFSESFSKPSLLKVLNLLYTKRRAQKKGLALRLAGYLLNGEAWIEELSQLVGKLRKLGEAVDVAARSLLGSDGTYRLVPQNSEAFFRILGDELEALQKGILQLVNHVRTALEEQIKDDTEEALVWELRGILRRLGSMGELIGRFLRYREEEEAVFYLELAGTKEKDSWVSFYASPLDLAPVLQEVLWSRFQTLVCVSATLTIGGSFRYWEGRVGLFEKGKNPFLRGIFPSPFPYKERVLVGVPSDAPLPDSEEYHSYLIRTIGGLLKISGGSALILFTSYATLTAVYEGVHPLLEQEGIPHMKQGDDDRSRLLTRFIGETRSVLFATDSFWEGIDAPGETLRLLVITRLPFKTPNDPLFQARSEYIEQRGGNAFMELSLPEAVMKFKQGFGRLMRRSSDYGAVIVLDGRLLKKSYGQIFLNSLPETNLCFDSTTEMIKRVGEFLARF
ncbi:MAG: ATP-dependent DNA helicase DinG [Treponemataceae bacterium]|nr:ATP-dependent DNA helicase DinG [Treponemataceae bacterium]